MPTKVLFPPKLCRLVDNDGTYQPANDLCLDAEQLIPAAKIQIINDEVQQWLTDCGIDWSFDRCWLSACSILIHDPAHISIVKLRWMEHGIILK
jgi:hypothetical protein